MVGIIFIVAVIWNVVGFGILYCYEESSSVYICRNSGQFMPYLNPVWLWKNYKINVIGLLFLILLFNLLCPLLSVVYWIAVFIKWICTVGRK
jgi:hypothetical protein